MLRGRAFFQMKDSRPRILFLSNVYDASYVSIRGEEIPPCLSSPKRRDLFACIHEATGAPLVILSSPPKALSRRYPRWLPPLSTTFANFPQLFCGNLDAPKIRIPFSWFSYALHVVRHVRRGDVLVLDNFELIYVMAAWLCRLLYGSNILLDYEDGKHLTDRGWPRLFSGPAEFFGKPLIQGAILAHPSLGERLNPKIPKVLVPGFYIPLRQKNRAPKPGADTRFIYAGSLDDPRGIHLLLKTIPLLPDSGWRLDITGSGPLERNVRQFTENPKFAKKVVFHSVLDAQAHSQLLSETDVGINLQISDNAVSQVTFPSKLFSYLSADLRVISTEASSVKPVLGNACLYLSAETPEALLELMTQIIQDKVRQTDSSRLESFSIPATSQRLSVFFKESVPFFA